MSHWIKDVVTFYYCCLWTGYNDCDYYMDQRPTRDCADYHPPTPGEYITMAIKYWNIGHGIFNIYIFINRKYHGKITTRK